MRVLLVSIVLGFPPATAMDNGFILTSKYEGHHNGNLFKNHFWISRDAVQASGRCLTFDCEAFEKIWLSKADGSELSGPYLIQSNNPNDGTDFVSGAKTYL